MTAPSFQSRVLGCFLGGAVGDALGAPVEFISLDELQDHFGVDGVTGFVEAKDRGAITDDTQMTLFTDEGLIRAKARYRDRGICDPPSVVHRAYLRWLWTQNVSAAGDDHPPTGSDSKAGWLVTIYRIDSIRELDLWDAIGEIVTDVDNGELRYKETRKAGSQGKSGG